MMVLWILFLTFTVGCPAVSVAAGDTVAEVDGVAITSEELQKPLTPQLSKLEEQIYNVKRQRLDALINDKLLAREAAKRQLSVPALLDGEVTSKVGFVTEREVDNFYQANKTQFKTEEAQAREQIRSHLQNQKLQARREAFLQALRSQSKVVVHLKAPPILRVDVKTDGAPVRGNVNAPVTIVEFSDFHCPFCKKVLPTLAQIESRYGDNVKLVFRDFPIEQIHPGVSKAHEAARCADEQGKFWAYHDKLFANGPKASLEIFQSLAKEAGLEPVAFETCLGSGKYQAAVKQDIEDGARASVTGTPAFFINGRLLTGAQPLEAFARVIDDELARVTVPPPFSP